MRISIPTIPLPLSNARVNAGSATRAEIEAGAARVASFLQRRNALVITGAGVSVDSGVRAYRGTDGRYSNPNYKPIFYHELVDDGPKGHSFRQRYWSRSFLGYPPVRDALSNPTHYAIAALQYLDYAPRLITQNVDGLHHKASPFSHDETQSRILELHGTLHRVHCRKRHLTPRGDFQVRLARENPSWREFVENLQRTGQTIRTNPDGDVDARGISFDDFVVPSCDTCAAQGLREDVMKPEVVFFGESIQNEVKERSIKLVDDCSSVLVVGTTLATYSAFRLIKKALEDSKPVLMLNLGPTRADGLDGVEKLDLHSRPVLLEACRILAGSSGINDSTLQRLLTSGIIQPPSTDDDDRAPRAAG